MAAGTRIDTPTGDGETAVVVGILGVSTAEAAVAGPKGNPLVLSDGTVMSFTVSRTVAMR
jgi:hypothetical protein